MKNTRKSKKTYDQLISGSYGTSTKTPSRNKNNARFSVSKSFDNGEVLAQKSKNNFLEYVVQNSIAVDTPFEEYLVPKKSASTFSRQSSTDTATVYSPTQRYTAAQETQVDVNNPLQDDGSKLAMLDRINDTNPATADTNATPVINNMGIATKDQNANNQNSNDAAYTNNKGTQFSMDESFLDQSKAAPTDDDFVKDMQAILTGQKVFDPINKKTVDKSQMSASQSQSENIQLPQIENKHAIFDQIAQSMEYAKAYDLGSIDIDKRFNDFDKINDIEKKNTEKKSTIKNVAVSNSKSENPIIGNEEFIKDLDIISRAANANKTSEASSAMSASEQSCVKPTEPPTPQVQDSIAGTPAIAVEKVE